MFLIISLIGKLLLKLFNVFIYNIIFNCWSKKNKINAEVNPFQVDFSPTDVKSVKSTDKLSTSKNSK